MDKWECNQCHWTGHVDDIIKKRVYFETVHEPEEFLWYCPECKSTEVDEINIMMCAWCEEEVVKDEDDICSECLTCYREHQADIAKGH